MDKIQFYQWNHATLDQCDDRMDERAFAFGDGFFSTMGVFAGQIIALDFHHQRINQGLVAFALQLDVALLFAELRHLATKVHQGIIKIIITRQKQTLRGYGFVDDGNNKAQVYLKTSPINTSFATGFIQDIPVQAPIRVITLGSQLAHRPSRLAGLKLIGCTEQVLAHAELLAKQAFDASIDDGLVANVHGEWICATMGNIFYQLSDDIWYTPPVDKSGVAGVMRAKIMASGICGVVRERVLADGDLLKITRLFITNAVRGITPVAEFNITSFGDDKQRLLEPIFTRDCFDRC
ncbi:aminotransferase class IV [Moraxella cuniculi]|uniref:Aminodeoxychorismate lyase n=1 Tax=Moraxella cuniculi TaxID=34061 RepID=A0A3S4R0K6_9GAMM|nr:aminotransferase class IV [Moraxella cuniculi]VEG12845.1 Aminodeoxychorismate lyase [Moraxella cuniculi]